MTDPDKIKVLDGILKDTKISVGLKDLVPISWKTVGVCASKISLSNWDREKEKEALDLFCHTLSYFASQSCVNIKVSDPYKPVSGTTDNSWEIDLTCEDEEYEIAIEGKFKTTNDGAVSDNRKEVFFDLFKCENYIDSKIYSLAFFLMLTNEIGYLKRASGDSKDFSTHQGRKYIAGTQLNARRARRKMPLPLTLRYNYTFEWLRISPDGKWNVLCIPVTKK